MNPRKNAKKSDIVDYGLTTDKYTWNQELDELSVEVPFKDFEGTLRGRDVSVTFEPFALTVGLKDKEPIVKGKLPHRVRVDECSWIIGDHNTVEIHLQKLKEEWWPSLLVGDAEIDMDLIEGSKYLDDSLLRKVKEAKKQKAAAGGTDEDNEGASGAPEPAVQEEASA